MENRASDMRDESRQRTSPEEQTGRRRSGRKSGGGQIAADGEENLGLGSK